jgi:hypothetical protein
MESIENVAQEKNVHIIYITSIINSRIQKQFMAFLMRNVRSTSCVNR